LFVCLLASILFLSLFIWWQTSHFDFSYLNTETKDWHQRFLQIVLRNLLNWCKCVGRNNLNNVLYPFSLFCFFISQNYSIIWFVSSLTEMLIGFWNDLCNVGTTIETKTKYLCFLFQYILFFFWQTFHISLFWIWFFFHCWMNISF
jgi:hypothetical protein